MAGGHKGGLFTGLSLEEWKSKALQKAFSNRPWPLNLSSTPEVYSFSKAFVPMRVSESAPLLAERVSRPHMHSCGGFNAVAAGDHVSQSVATFSDVVVFWLLTCCPDCLRLSAATEPAGAEPTS